MNHQMRLTFNNDRNICRSLFGLSKCRREESMQIKIAKKKKQSNSFAFRCWLIHDLSTPWNENLIFSTTTKLTAIFDQISTKIQAGEKIHIETHVSITKISLLAVVTPDFQDFK